VKIPLVAIVDDEELLCSSLVNLMRSLGYRAESFGSAEALLASSNLLVFDCVVADVHMPGMGGLELARRLGEQHGQLPVILITASPERHLDDLAIALGARCLLRKPIEIKALAGWVESCLSAEGPPR
jgi:FixJ family two-component response regulator